MSSVSKMRVRAILDGMDSMTKAALKKLLPKDAKMPDGVETARYPSAVLGILEKGFEYSLLGCITEDLLRNPSNEIDFEELSKAILKYQPDTSADLLKKVEKSKTTQPFLDHVIGTRVELEAIARGELQGESAVSYDAAEGHPDMRTTDQIFEVKLTGMLKQNWVAFLYQVFAYAALDPIVKDIYLVLPLQETVWQYSVEKWSKRTEYRDLLNETSKKLQSSSITDALVGAMIRAEHRIGFHVPKAKVLRDTFSSLTDLSSPYQMFLGAPNNTKMSISDADLANAAAYIGSKRLSIFVHSQYLINLCTTPTGDDEWNTDLLKKNLQYANAMGCKGVVVHVGKSTTKPLAEARENMRKNIRKVLEHATATCPLLLETPAGQGTEMLTGETDFIKFVDEFADERLRVCVDTCHVFACGHNPLEYIERVAVKPNLLKLIHYNDSAAPCGSCVDRHALMGTGHIGMDRMRAIAEQCSKIGVPMIIE